MITQAINLNLIPGQVLPRINVSQYDKGSRTLVFNIYNGSVLYSIPEDATINIQGTKPDFTSFQYSCMHSGSVATVNLQEQMATVAGEVNCELAISQVVEGVVTLLGTCNFIINVEASAVSDDTVISETDLPLIQQAIQAATEAQASATSAAASAAEAESWSANPPYIGANGNWFVYDIENETFVDSGMPSRGEQGETGATPDISMTAAVDTSVGTPSIVISKTGTSTSPFFHLDFSGLKGQPGSTPNISMTASVNTSVGTPSIVITKEGTEEDPIFDLEFSNLKGETGEAGPQGETGPAGATGNGIASVVKTSTSGLVDTYTITFTDGTTTTFTVTNGQDGQGAGDMTKAIYDALNAVADAGGIPAYVAAQIAAIPSVPVMTGATSLADGTIGQVPKPMAGEEDYVLHGDGTWRAGGGGGGTNIVPIPEAGSGTYTYDGTEQTYTFASIDSTYINITGNKQTAAGTYTITCSLKSSSDIWTDMTKADKTFTWTINKATVAIPVADSVTYTYDGTQQTFAFTTTIDTTLINVTDNTRTDAGSQTVKCALIDANNYQWADSTTEVKTYAWTINKAASSISVSPASITLDADNLTATLVPTTTGDGAVSYSGYDSNIITIAGNVVTATQATGNTTITATIAETTNYMSASTTISVVANFLEIVAFDDEDLSKVKAMLDAHYAGQINIHDYWAVGNSRTVIISAMSATGVGESHAQQSATIVLTNAGGKYLADGVTECAFQWDLKNCLQESGYMNSTNTNGGGWKDSARRTWCNNVFYPALPEGFRNCMKQFINQSGLGGGSSSGVEDTTDWTALRAEIEVQGATNHSVSGEGSQLTYYATSANRVKKQGDSGSDFYWWLRSPGSGNNNSFCYVGPDGSIGYNNATGAFGIAPCGCI